MALTHIRSVIAISSILLFNRSPNGRSLFYILIHIQILSRKTSHPYVTRGKLQFTLCQILLNAIALLIIGGGLAAYFRGEFLKLVIFENFQRISTSDYENMVMKIFPHITSKHLKLYP